MLGAIIGDIAGSSYEVDEMVARKSGSKRDYKERIKILDYKVPLFNDNSSYTDDSVLTCAIAESILNNNDYEYYLRKYGLRELTLGFDKYGRSRFGKGFVAWLSSTTQGESYGNGSAMRVSPIGYYYEDIGDVIEHARLASIPSHNNEDAIKGATAVATSIFMARKKYSKEQIKKYIEGEYAYDLNFNLLDLQNNYEFTSKCCDSVPQAIYCFLISDDFEDAIRKSISIGGDTDTIACIAGSISEAFYGIPRSIITDVHKFIPSYILKIMSEFCDTIEKRNSYAKTIRRNS